ncbi:MAG: SH3 domain-containing protein [Clostridia bacterium]|nr:SH3 domain-containing protein [Clostridia bacterium]
MKRVLAILIVLCMLVAAIPLGASADSTAYVVGGWLRLRALPSFDAETIASYYTGTRVTVYSTTGAWSYVQGPDGQNGYMYSAYLSSQAPASGSGTSTSITGYVTSGNGGNVALRSGAGKAYTAIAYYAVGTKLTILELGTTWDRVKIGSTTGYMMAKYVTTTPPASQPVVTNPPSSSTSYTAYVTSQNGKGVNLRTGAGKGYASIGLYQVGTPVTVLQKGSIWDYVQIGQTKGYMMAAYLTTKQPSSPTVTNPPPAVPTQNTVAYVTSSNGKAVRLRSGPGTNYSILGSFQVGTQVIITNRGTTWSSIQVGSLSGYMMSMYLTVSSPVSPVTPVVTSGYTAWVTSANGQNVILRAGPSTASVAITTYPVGTQVRVLRNEGSWDYISVGNQTGYMMHKYLTTTQNSYTITGVSISNPSPRVGDVLTASIYPAGASATYTWVDDHGVQLSTSATYTVSATELGRKIRVRVVATGTSSGSATSNFTDPVASAITSGVVQGCTISNTSPTVGDILTATASPNGALVSFIWYREGGTPVATGSTYTVQNYDLGYSLYCTAVGHSTWTGTARSADTAKVQAQVVSDIKLSGTVTLPSGAVVGTILQPALSLNSTQVTYQWFQNGLLVGTGTTLTLNSTMIGDDINLLVTAIPGSGYTGSVRSNYCIVQSSVSQADPSEAATLVSPVTSAESITPVVLSSDESSQQQPEAAEDHHDDTVALLIPTSQEPDTAAEQPVSGDTTSQADTVQQDSIPDHTTAVQIVPDVFQTADVSSAGQDLATPEQDATQASAPLVELITPNGL